MVNKVILIGNLGRDPEIRYLEGNIAVARFSVATNESYKDKKGDWQTQTEWHDIVCWRNLAERAEKQLKKGSQVYLEGKLTHRKYQDKEGNGSVCHGSGSQYHPDTGSPGITTRRKRRGLHPEDLSRNATFCQSGSGEQQADDDLPF